MAEVKGEVEKKSNTNKEMVNVPEALGNTMTASQTQELSDKGFLDILYEKIADVLGGDNPNQYLCLTLPGTIINPEKYKYDCFLQALFGQSCKTFLDIIASPNWTKLQSLDWQLSCQPHSHCRQYLVVTA